MSNPQELNKYFRTIQPGDLLGKYSLVSFKDNPLAAKGKDGKDAFVSQVAKLLIGTGNGQAQYGIPKLSEIVSNLSAFIAKGGDDPGISQFHDIIRVYGPGAKIAGSEGAYWKNDKGEASLSWDAVMKQPQAGLLPQLGVIQSASPFVSQNVRDVNEIALFMNSIPTVELNRAVPFLDVKFQFKREPSPGDERLRVPSLLKFLNGGIDPKAFSADVLMNKATMDKQITIDGSSETVFRSGMELFTAPNTLLNPSAADNTSARFVPVIDNFRPFMSIESFEIIAAPTVGLFSYKTAKLSLVLHDRSRLAEISDLVRPEIYGNTTLSISYGWNHPDDDSRDNSFGSLLNRMAIYNEKYGIVNCSYAFDNVGQCKISISLAMKGTQDLRVVKIGESSEYQNETKAIQDLTAQISDLRQAAGLARPDGFQKEVRAYQILDAAERGEIIKDLKQPELVSLINQLKKAKGSTKEAAGKLADKLESLFGGPKVGMLETLKKTLESAIDGKFNELEEGEDPFLPKDESNPIFKLIQEGNPAPNSKNVKGKRIVSLAKVFLTFVGKPFQAGQNVNEIQFLFYQFNSGAGQLGNTNIGSFPIEIEFLRKVLKSHIAQKADPNLSIYEFMMLLQSAVICDPRALGYGLRQAYLPRSPGGEPDLVKKGSDPIENVLAQAVKNNGSFKFPVVEAYVETNGGRPFAEGELLSEKDHLDIMRIHIFDKAASPYEPMMQLLKSQTGLQDVVKAKSGNAKSDESINSLKTQAISSAQAAGLKLTQDGSGKITVSDPSSYQSMKEFITQVLPTITYGANNTAVANGALQTMQNHQLSTVNMLRTAGRQNSTEPNGSAQGGIPLRTIPAQLDMNFHGCPLLNINQQFFIDFQTGTTIDNIYLLTHLVHMIKPGKFETHGKFVPLDAYGVYESIISKINQLKDELKAAVATSK